MLLTKEQILGSKDMKTVEVEVPEWGGKVLVSVMRGIDRDRFENELVKGKDMNLENVRAKLCAMTIVDESGKRIFGDKDIIELSHKSSIALTRVFEAAQKINAIGKQEIDELTKNSIASQ